MPTVNKLHDRVQFVQSVFQRRAGQYKCKLRLQTLDDARRLSLPVFDPLTFVQNNEIPLRGFDRHNVTEDLFVVADREERRFVVLRGSIFGFPHDELRCSSGELLNFIFPL